MAAETTLAQAQTLTGAPTRWWTRLSDGRFRCDVCPRECKMREGQRGLCFVRGAAEDGVVLTTYGRSSGFCVDPIEKKPLNHFLPGTPVLSFGTAGCNLACDFCQNWGISKSREMDSVASTGRPEVIMRAAKQLGCRSIAFTYNDPVVFLEYAMDIAKVCRAEGIKNVAVTAGYMNAGPREEFYRHIDAANIDLKAFTEGFYRDITKGQLEPVKETLIYLKRETKVWFEITTLLIPGLNDSDAEIISLSEWIVDALGPDIPLHFSAFKPDFRMKDRPATPPETLFRARRLARAAGVRHVYVGNIHAPSRASTWCHACGGSLIKRDWYELLEWRLTPDGGCPDCGTPLPGVFEEKPGNWGRKRQSVRLAP